MHRNLILYPVLVQVALTLLIYVRLLGARARAIRSGKVEIARVALHQDAWPDGVVQISNSLRSQYELPVLFYVVCGVLWALEAVGVAALVAAWLFVASRLAHAWIHLTSNRIRHRARVFAVGWWIVIAMVLLTLWQLVGSTKGTFTLLIL